MKFFALSAALLFAATPVLADITVPDNIKMHKGGTIAIEGTKTILTYEKKTYNLVIRGCDISRLNGASVYVFGLPGQFSVVARTDDLEASIAEHDNSFVAGVNGLVFSHKICPLYGATPISFD